MGDKFIQRGQATIADGNSTVTITAGVDYIAPAGPSKAWIDVIGSIHSGTPGTGSNVTAQNGMCWPTNAGNVATSVTFERYGSGSDLVINWEIKEYTGPGGGANEFVVLDHFEQSLTGGQNSKTTGSTGIAATDDNDVVPWLCGQASNYGSTVWSEGRHRLTWNGGADTVTIDRIRVTAVASTVAISVIEFKGSNYTVELATHAYSTPGNIETETLSHDVGSMSRAFIHQQTDSGSQRSSNVMEVYLSGTDEVSFFVHANGYATSTAHAWVISNSQTTGTVMKVTRYSTSGPTASTKNVTVTAVADLSTTSLGEMSCSCSQDSGSSGMEVVVGRLTSTTNVETRRSRWNVGDTMNMWLATIEWPTAGAADENIFTRFPRQAVQEIF